MHRGELMAPDYELAGQCLCGSLAFTVNGPLRDVIDCHCHRCRRWTGHHMAATQTAHENIRFADDAALRWFAPEPTVEYGFCRQCGSSMFWRVVGAATWSICAGAFNPPTGLRTSSAWWLSEASDYFDPSAGVVERHQTE
jgi:hypothetical protein